MQTYHISNEAKGTSKSFTSKRLARKQMAQQNDGERVLVAHKVWMTRHGVATPVKTSNL